MTQECPPVNPIEPQGPLGSEEEGVQNESTSQDRPRAIGKNKTVIDSGNYMLVPKNMISQQPTPFGAYRDDSRPWVNYSNESFGGTRVLDRFRFESKSFWRRLQEGTTVEDEYLDTADLDYGIVNGINAFRKVNNSFYSYRSIPFKVNLVSELMDWVPSGGGSLLSGFCKKQIIEIEARQVNFSRADDFGGFYLGYWSKWVNGGQILGQDFQPLFDLESKFSDHVHVTSVPFSPRELMDINNINKPAVVSIESEYNFRSPRYEVALSNLARKNGGHEPFLPNLYVMLLEKKSQNLDADNSDFKRHITLEGRIRDVFVDILDAENGRKVGESDKGQYFYKWGLTYDRGPFNVTMRDLLKKHRKLMFSPRDLDVLTSFNDKKTSFPMYVDLQFSTDRETSLADAINETELSTTLMKTMTLEAIKTKRFTAVTEIVSSVAPKSKETLVRVNKERKILDLVEWWERFKDSEENIYNRVHEFARDSVMLGTSAPEVFTTEGNQTRFVKTILSLMFNGKFRQILKNKTRTYEELMNGKPAYSETLFYKITKYETNSLGTPVGSPIQEIFVPNSSDLDILRYIDTQVAYDKTYRYTVYSYEAVFGTEYEYKLEEGRPSFALEGSPKARAVVYMKPSIQLIETPMISMNTVVVDRPPLPPEVDIVPYRNVNNQVLMNFNSVIGETTAFPITFNQSEDLAIEKIRRRKDLRRNDPIEFKTDDVLESIEIYRTNFKPRSYRDFANFLHATVQTDLKSMANDDFNQSSTAFLLPSTSLVDTLSPNVKYYYTFRAIDLRGNFSNPSPVYLVELVSRDGVTYPRIKIVDMETSSGAKAVREMKKYIKISPSVLQKVLNVENISEAETASDARVSVGNTEDSLFVKRPDKNKVKVRLTSKDSGKKIDINLFFSHEHDK